MFSMTADENQKKESESSETSGSNSNLSSPAERFHTDMRRVLQSRRQRPPQTKNSASQNGLDSLIDMDSNSGVVSRRTRPTLLESDIDGAERVASMLQHLVTLGYATEESFQIVLEAFAGRGRVRWRQATNDYDSVSSRNRNNRPKIVCAADVVGDLLDQAWELLDGNVSTESCNLVLKAYATCATPRGDRFYANSAQALVDRMEQAGTVITEETLAHLVHAWAWQQGNRQSGDCADLAEAALDRLNQLSSPPPSPEVLLQCYDWLLEARSKSSALSAPKEADKLLQTMKRVRLQMDEPSTCRLPSAESFTNAILAWSKSREEGGVDRAEELLMELCDAFEANLLPDQVQPDLIAFNGVVSAWARRGRPDKAEEILKILRDKFPMVAPDVMTYNTVLFAYLKSGEDKRKKLDKMLSILKYMEESSHDNGKIAPDCFTYNTLTQAWINSRHPEAADRSLDLIHKMVELWKAGDTSLEPENRRFNVVINALAKQSRSPQAPQKAYELLRQMQSLGIKSCEPDVITYTSVIECMSRSNDPNAHVHSQDLLKELIEAYEEAENRGDEDSESLLPNARTYSMTILAMAKSPTLDNVLQANQLFDDLKQLHDKTQHESTRPNIFVYNYVLNCAANCIGTQEEKLQAFQVAASVYKALRKSADVQSDSFTYAFWFKCCNNLLPTGDLRTKCLTYAFDKCKTDGLVTPAVLKRLLAGTPPSLARKILKLPKGAQRKNQAISIDNLPPSWSRNS